MTLIMAELHCHTHHSRDSLMIPQRILEVARQRGIHRLAITDHNTIEGALEAKALDPERVIVGEEIKTTKGELLAYFVNEEVPRGLTPEATIELLRRQGALISVSHPFDTTRGGTWTLTDLEAILPSIDALEVFNSRTLTPRPNNQARKLVEERALLATAGSDAHAYFEIGRTVMRLPPFDDAQGLRQALSQASIQARQSSPLVHLYSRYATWRRMLGWQPPTTSTGG